MILNAFGNAIIGTAISMAVVGVAIDTCLPFIKQNIERDSYAFAELCKSEALIYPRAYQEAMIAKCERNSEQRTKSKIQEMESIFKTFKILTNQINITK